MDHDQAVRQKATERYLLDELDPELRDQFEEHLFDCQDCAMDVRAAAMFVEQSKAILGDTPVATTVKQPEITRTKASWFAWLRPAFAVPALALLLAVIGYQNFVTYPRLTAAANDPKIGPWASLNVSTRGSETKTIKVHPGEGFGLLINLPPEDGFASYAVDLYNPAGKLEWSGPISKTTVDDGRQVYIPGQKLLPGTYTVAVRGINPAGQSQELSRQPIELQMLK